jgi:hypothetical protein
VAINLLDVENFVFFFPSLMHLDDKEEGGGIFFLGVSILQLSPREVTLLLQ